MKKIKPSLTDIGDALVEKSLPAPALRILTPFILHASEGLSSREIAAELKRRGVAVSHTKIAQIVRRHKRNYTSNKYHWYQLEGILGAAQTLSSYLGVTIDDVLRATGSEDPRPGAVNVAKETDHADYLAARKTLDERWVTLAPLTKEHILAAWTEIAGRAADRRRA